MEVLPIILEIAGIAAEATQIGTSIYGAMNRPGIPKISTALQPQSAQINAAQTAAVSQTLPTLQALTGGSLSPEYAAQFGATQTGLGNNPQAAGNIQAAINQFFGLTAPGTTGLTPSGSTTGGGTTSIIDLLSRAGGGGGKSSSGGGLVDSMFGGDEFKGLVAA